VKVPPSTNTWWSILTTGKITGMEADDKMASLVYSVGVVSSKITISPVFKSTD
jgi:hypothetical protein